MRRQRGAALLLVVAVLFAVTAAAAFATIRREARRDATELAQQQALAQARDALRGLAYQRHCNDHARPLDTLLACPEAATEGDAAALCPGLTRGWLPWRTLGLAPLHDASGTCLWIERNGLGVRVIAPGAPRAGQVRAPDPARVICPGSADPAQYLDASDVALDLTLDPAALTAACP
ncbi:MAG: hypothetical protein U1F18_13510 [Steroidobacteraceae bacterium]